MSSDIPRLRQTLVQLVGKIEEQYEKNNVSATAETRKMFADLYFLVSQLLQQKHTIERERTYKGLILMSVDGSWNVALKEHRSDCLYVEDEILDKIEHMPDPDASSRCPRVLKVVIGHDNHMSLETSQNCQAKGNFIYGIRCHLCRRGDTSPGSISDICYVGQTKRSVHERVCEQHGRNVQKVVDGEASEVEPNLYNHICMHIKKGQVRPREANIFRRAFDVFILPSGSEQPSDGNIRYWEIFWQWTFRSLDDFGAYGKR
jgi:hypothetical protein